jgi:hypothetical protein
MPENESRILITQVNIGTLIDVYILSKESWTSP